MTAQDTRSTGFAEQDEDQWTSPAIAGQNAPQPHEPANRSPHMPDSIVTEQIWEQVKHLVARERVPSLSYPEHIIRRGVTAAIWIDDNSADWQQLPPEYGDRHTMSSVTKALSRAGALQDVIQAIRELAEQGAQTGQAPTASLQEGQRETPMTPAASDEPESPEPPAATTETASATPPEPEDNGKAADENPTAYPPETARQTEEPGEPSTGPTATEEPASEPGPPPSVYAQPIGPIPTVPDPDLALIRHLEHWINAHYYDAYVSAYPDNVAHHFYHHFRPVLDLMFHWYRDNNPGTDEPPPRLIDIKDDYAILEGQDFKDAIINAASWIRDDITEFYARVTELLAIATHGQQIPYRHLEHLTPPKPYPPASPYEASESRSINEPVTAEAPSAPPSPPARTTNEPRPPASQRRQPTDQAAPQSPTGRRPYAKPVAHAEVMRMATEYASERDGVIVPREFAQHLTDGPLAHRTFQQNLGTVRNVMGLASHGSRFTNLGNGRWQVSEAT